MEGYDVVTSDDRKIGKVVGTRDGHLIVELGTLFKSRHAVPETFGHANDEERIVRVTVPREIVSDSPKVDDDTWDTQAIAQHYGLAEGEAAPETEGYGELDPDETSRSAEVQGRRVGVTSAEEERVGVRENMRPEGRDPQSEAIGHQIHPDRREYGKE